MRGAFRGGFGKQFSPGLMLPAQNSVAITGWELEWKISRFRWIVVILCLCSLPLWGTTDRLLLAGTCLVLGVGNWKLLTLLHHQAEADHLRCCRRLARVIDWVGGLALIAALDPLTPLSFLGPLVALVLVTQLRFGRIGLRLAVIGAATIIAGRTALAVLSRGSPGMLPTERLAIALITVAGLYYLLDALRLNTQLVPAAENATTSPAIEGSTTTLKLPRRYRELLPLLARPELTYRDIAHELNIAPTTSSRTSSDCPKRLISNREDDSPSLFSPKPTDFFKAPRPFHQRTWIPPLMTRQPRMPPKCTPIRREMHRIRG